MSVDSGVRVCVCVCTLTWQANGSTLEQRTVEDRLGGLGGPQQLRTGWTGTSSDADRKLLGTCEDQQMSQSSRPRGSEVKCAHRATQDKANAKQAVTGGLCRGKSRRTKTN